MSFLGKFKLAQAILRMKLNFPNLDAAHPLASGAVARWAVETQWEVAIGKIGWILSCQWSKNV